MPYEVELPLTYQNINHVNQQECTTVAIQRASEIVSITYIAEMNSHLLIFIQSEIEWSIDYQNAHIRYQTVSQRPWLHNSNIEIFIDQTFTF